MKNLFLTILLTLCLSANLAFAEEEGAAAEKKNATPRPDAGAAIVSVLQLPIVQGWQKSVEEQGSNFSLSVWGEAIKEVNNQKCWGISVGKNNGVDTHLWKRFCVAKNGSEIWVELAPSQDDSSNQVNYDTYEEWVKKCHPTDNSLGTC